MTIVDEIVTERRRQIEVEGWTLEHDDGHEREELTYAAACYATPRRIFVASKVGTRLDYKDAWPWGEVWWKPKDRRRDLVRAAALIVAEIERLDRAAVRSAKETGDAG